MFLHPNNWSFIFDANCDSSQENTAVVIFYTKNCRGFFYCPAKKRKELPK